MPLERFLRIISAKECARSVSATNSVYFDGRKAASTRDKIGLRKLALLLPFEPPNGGIKICPKDSHLSIVLCILRRAARLYFARLASSVARGVVSKPARPTALDVRPIG